MEAQIEDIQEHRTSQQLNKLKDILIDCTRNIKSNDETFSISTLPSISTKLTKIVDDIAEAMNRLEASQSAFLELNDLVENIEAEVGPDEIVQSAIFSNKYEDSVKEKYNKLRQSNRDKKRILTELNKILRPIEEDVQVEAPTLTIPKDPITKRDIRIAVRSTVCNHVYDQEGIEDYFKQKELAKKRNIKCPQAGCTNKTMTREELVPDDELNRFIQSNQNQNDA